MTRRCMFGLAMAVMGATLAYGAEPTIVVDDAHSLAQLCRSAEQVTGGSRRKVKAPAIMDTLLCLGYMQAMQDLTTLADDRGERFLGVCPAENTTLLQLVQAFLDYSRTHTDHGDDKAAVAVIRSLQIAYPCPPMGRTAQEHDRNSSTSGIQRVPGRSRDEKSQ